MLRSSQFNIAIYSVEDASKVPDAHKIIDHYKADHCGMSKFAAPHELLTIADSVLSKERGRLKGKSA